VELAAAGVTLMGGRAPAMNQACYSGLPMLLDLISFSESTSRSVQVVQCRY
jgi:hypothetical protein